MCVCVLGQTFGELARPIVVPRPLTNADEAVRTPRESTLWAPLGVPLWYPLSTIKYLVGCALCALVCGSRSAHTRALPHSLWLSLSQLG